jgi:hypothetical protein
MRAGLLALTLIGCSRPAATAPVQAPASEAEAEAPTSDATATETSSDAGASPDASPPPHSAPRLTAAQAADVLFLPKDTRPMCDQGDDGARIACLIKTRYVSDTRAAEVAQDLYERTGDVAGLLPAETMEGGWRGTLHLIPALPVLEDRKHLEWVAGATRDYDAFFERLTQGQKSAPSYVWRSYAFLFMRSVAARTPSAYSSRWTIAYNLAGSLNTSADAVRELLFHEIFHSNDTDRGDWAVRVLGTTFDSIIARCGTTIACLTPFTPTEMTVRGGTYYAFQPNNGAAVREYAAEIALRYYREQRAVLFDLPHPKRFKCGPKENASSWKLVVDEFFGGIDLTPPC